jgi:hypothetical protein
MRRLQGQPREFLFAVLNVAGVFCFLFYGSHEHFGLRFATYLALIVGLYLGLCAVCGPARWVALARIFRAHRWR